MIWNLIRDFYVMYVFGGISSEYQQYGNRLMIGYGKYQGGSGHFFANGVLFWINDEIQISLCDWLSTTATIVTMVLFVVLLFMLATWLFKLFRGLFSLGK